MLQPPLNNNFSYPFSYQLFLVQDLSNNVKLTNYVIIVEQGNINFNGNGHVLDNVALITQNGSINLASVQSDNLSVLANGTINMNRNARFGGNTLIASGGNNSNINFDVATVTNDSHSKLRVISQRNIIFNSSSSIRGEFIAAGNFTANGNSNLVGSIRVKGDITINGGIDIVPLPQTHTVNAATPPIIENLTGPTVSQIDDPVTYRINIEDADSSALTVKWDFGDDSPPVSELIANQSSTNSVDVTHTFTTEGNYPVTVTVNDSEGGMSASSIDVTVNPNREEEMSSGGLYELSSSEGTSGLYRVRPTEGETVELSFNLIESQATYQSEVGIIVLDNPEGRIDNLLPGDSGYQQAALLSPDKQILLEAGQPVGTFKNLTLTAGQYVMFYLVQNDTSSNVSNSNVHNSPVFFSAFADLLNRDRFEHFQITSTETGELTLAIEDLWAGGDLDFNDLVISVTSANILVPGTIGETVATTVVYQGKSADINSEIGLLVEERDARIDNLLPGDKGYEIAALNSDRI